MSNLPELDFSIDYYDRLEKSDLFQGKMIMVSNKNLIAQPGDIISSVVCLKCKDVQYCIGPSTANANCQNCNKDLK